MNIYVGNLDYSVDQDELTEVFSEFGEVKSAKVIMDRDSGRSKGFGFVEMSDDGEAQQAINELDGADLKGRNMRVNQARERSNNNQRRGGYRSY